MSRIGKLMALTEEKVGGLKIRKSKLLIGVVVISLFVEFLLVSPLVSASSEVSVNETGSIDLTQDNLIVESGERVVIENRDIETPTDFIVKENGTLVIKNSHLFMAGEHHHANNSYIYGDLIVENSTIYGEKGIPVGFWFLSDLSQGRIQNSEMDGGKEFPGVNLGLEAGAGVKIENCELDGIESYIGPREGSEKLTLEVKNTSAWIRLSFEGFDKKIKIENLYPTTDQFHYSDPSNDLLFENVQSFCPLDIISRGSATKEKNQQLIIENSLVEAGAFPGTELDLIDSKISQLKLDFGMLGAKDTYHFEGLYPGHFENGTIINKPHLRIRAENSYIGGWGIDSAGPGLLFNFVLENSHFNEVKVDQDLVTNDTVINYFQIYHNKRGVLEFENTVIESPFQFIDLTDVTIKGDLTMHGNPKQIDLWGGLKYMKVERFYPLKVEDERGNPIENVELRLYNSDNQVVWENETGSEGEAKFSINFNENNYTEAFVLEAENSDLKIQREVTLTSDTPIELRAETGPSIYGITISTDPFRGGSVNLSPPGKTYENGAEVILSTEAGGNYEFDHWSGDVSGTSKTITLTMNENKNVTAHFVKIHSLKTSAKPTKGGFISINPSQENYENGTQITITAEPALGYKFSHWSGDFPENHEGDNEITLSMDSDKEITAYFNQVQEGEESEEVFPFNWLTIAVVISLVVILSALVVNYTHLIKD